MNTSPVLKLELLTMMVNRVRKLDALLSVNLDNCYVYAFPHHNLTVKMVNGQPRSAVAEEATIYGQGVYLANTVQNGDNQRARRFAYRGVLESAMADAKAQLYQLGEAFEAQATPSSAAS